MDNTSKFSSLVEELAGVWWNWMKSDTLCRDSQVSYEVRAEAAHRCEDLINREHFLTEKMDGFFNE